MQENEFEKRVQERMDEFRLHPSPSVWSNVERELSAKRKRRVIYVVLLLAGLGLLGYSGYTFFSHDSRPNLVHENTQPLQKQPASPGQTPANTTSPGATQSNLNTPENQGNVSPTSNPATTEITTSRPAVDNPVAPLSQDNRLDKPATVKQKPQGKPQDIPVLSQQKPATRNNNSRTKQLQEPETKNVAAIDQEKRNNSPVITPDLPVNDAVITDKPKNNITADNVVTQNAVAKNDSSTSASSVENRLPGNDLVVNDTTLTPGTDTTQAVADAKPKKNPKIRWKAEVSGGWAFSQNKILSFNAAASNADYVMYYSTPAPQAGSSGSGRIIRSPSPVRSAPAFKVGLVGEMPLTDKSSLSFGLRYAMMSERLEIGTFQDTVYRSSSFQSSNSAINGAYGGAKQKRYSGRYHFLELPVLYHLQLNRGKKVPISWNGGLSVSYMLGTNALVYDTAGGGIYYRNSDLFNKLHLNLLTGVFFRFGAADKWQWSIGPEFSMDLRRLMKQDPFTEKRYLMYGGVTARFMLPRKK